MSEVQKTKVLIIGSGPAGYTAAIYAARANLSPMLVQGYQPGGQLTITTEIENFPGFENPVGGTELMEQMQKQAEHVGAKLFSDTIEKVELQSRPFKAYGQSGTVYEGDTLIIATGAAAKWLGMECEDKFKGFGVSACATCDGFFYRGKDVAVIGGGNSAVEEAIFLTNFANSVTLVHRRGELRAEKIAQKRLFNNKKIKVIWDSVADEFLGNPPGTENAGITGLRIKNVKTGETSELAVDGIFVAIGHSPNTHLFKGMLDMDDEGYLVTKPGTPMTNIKGVYAAGDVADKHYRQAVTAAAMGCMAALEADRYIIDCENC